MNLSTFNRNFILFIISMIIFIGNTEAQVPGSNCANAVALTLPSVAGNSISTGNQTTCGTQDDFASGSYCTSSLYGGGGGGTQLGTGTGSAPVATYGLGGIGGGGNGGYTSSAGGAAIRSSVSGVNGTGGGGGGFLYDNRGGGAGGSAGGSESEGGVVGSSFGSSALEVI
jgi:hypothetical protein